MVEEVKCLALRYTITGREQVAPLSQYATLVEYGLANFRKEAGRNLISIDEPIVVRAASFFYGLLNYERSRLLDRAGRLSEVGNEFEAYVALALFDAKNPLELSAEAPVNVKHVGIPPEFEGRWQTWYPEEAKVTGVLGCDSKQGEDLVEFLGDNPSHAFLFPDEYAGADVFKRVCDCDNADRRLQTSIQVKFQKKVKNPQRAIETTDLEEVFTHSDGSVIKTRQEVRDRVLNAFRSTGLPLLRMLVAYPTTVEDQEPVQVLGDKELLLIIDSRNARLVFKQEDLQLLEDIYAASVRRRREQLQADTTSATDGERKRQNTKRGLDSTLTDHVPKRRSTREVRPVNRYGYA